MWIAETFTKGSMNPKFQGLGYAPLLIIIGAFLVLKPLFSSFATGSEDEIRQSTNAAVLVLSGVLTLFLTAWSDRKTETKFFSLRTWTTEIGESHDICFYVPMRIVGALLLIIGLVIDVFF